MNILNIVIMIFNRRIKMINILMPFMKGFEFPPFEDFYKIITKGDDIFHCTNYKTHRGNYECDIGRFYNRECIEISISNIYINGYEGGNDIYHDVLYLNVVSIKDKVAIKKWYEKQIKNSNKTFKEYMIKKYFTGEEE